MFFTLHCCELKIAGISLESGGEENKWSQQQFDMFLFPSVTDGVYWSEPTHSIILAIVVHFWNPPTETELCFLFKVNIIFWGDHKQTEVETVVRSGPDWCSEQGPTFLVFK